MRGMAAQLLEGIGVEVSAAGVAEHYGPARRAGSSTAGCRRSRRGSGRTHRVCRDLRARRTADDDRRRCDSGHGRGSARPRRAGAAVTRPGDVPALQCVAVEGIGEVREGDDLAALIADRIELEAGDVLVVTSKIVSKAEGRLRRRRAQGPAGRRDRAGARPPGRDGHRPQPAGPRPGRRGHRRLQHRRGHRPAPAGGPRPLGRASSAEASRSGHGRTGRRRRLRHRGSRLAPRTDRHRDRRRRLPRRRRPCRPGRPLRQRARRDRHRSRRRGRVGRRPGQGQAARLSRSPSCADWPTWSSTTLPEPAACSAATPRTSSGSVPGRPCSAPWGPWRSTRQRSERRVSLARAGRRPDRAALRGRPTLSVTES